MIFVPINIHGAYVIQIEKTTDERGFFARTFCKETFQQHGLVTNFIQMSTCFNHHAGQARGMHYQAEPHAETKLVRVIKGAVQDVLLDLREESPSYNLWTVVELSSDLGNMLYIPKGVAHGYKTLHPGTELFYMMDVVYTPHAAKEVAFPEGSII